MPRLTPTMHIFLDTNIFWGDPFWRNNYSKVLWRQLQSNTKVKFYIADVVIAELEKNHELNSLSAISKVKKAAKELLDFTNELNKYRDRQINLQLPAFDLVPDDLSVFYNKILSWKNVSLLKASDEILRSVFELVKAYEPPFFKKQVGEEKKFEYKDALIWGIYHSWCIKKNIKEPHILTKNINDFVLSSENRIPFGDGKSNGSFIIKRDGRSFVFHNSIASLVKCFPDVFGTRVPTEYPEWLREVLVDPFAIDGKIGSYNHSIIKSYLDRHYRHAIHTKLVGELNLGYRNVKLEVVLANFDANYPFENADITAFKDYAIVTKKGKARYHVVFKIINPETYINPESWVFETKTSERDFYFNFILNEQGHTSHFEITLDDGVARGLKYPWEPLE
jgi:hypothetical protein